MFERDYVITVNTTDTIGFWQEKVESRAGVQVFKSIMELLIGCGYVFEVQGLFGRSTTYGNDVINEDIMIDVKDELDSVGESLLTNRLNIAHRNGTDKVFPR